MTAIETLKARLPNGNKAKAELIYDQHAANPREGDNLGTILIAPNKAHWIANRDVAVDISIPLGKNPHEHWENIRKQQLNLKKSDIVAYPITKHEHGEISLQLCYKSGWERGVVVGFIYVTKETLRKCYGVDRITKSIIERAKNCLQSELDMLTAWLNGDCYGYQIKEYALTDDGLDWEEVDVLDACWGYLDKEQALDDMQNMLKLLTATKNPLTLNIGDTPKNPLTLNIVCKNILKSP